MSTLLEKIEAMRPVGDVNAPPTPEQFELLDRAVKDLAPVNREEYERGKTSGRSLDGMKFIISQDLWEKDDIEREYGTTVRMLFSIGASERDLEAAKELGKVEKLEELRRLRRQLERMTKTQWLNHKKVEYNAEKSKLFKRPGLTRREAILEIIARYFKAEAYHLFDKVLQSVITKYQYTKLVVHGEEGDIPFEIDEAVNLAVAQWLQSKGHYTGPATQFLDLMDLSQVEAELAATAASIPGARAKSAADARTRKSDELRRERFERDWAEKLHGDDADDRYDDRLEPLYRYEAELAEAAEEERLEREAAEREAQWAKEAAERAQLRQAAQ